MSTAAKPVIVVTAANIAPQSVALLSDFELVYAGKAATEEETAALCRRHAPVAVIVRTSKVGAMVLDAAPSIRVLSKHGSGIDNIDQEAAKARGVKVVAAAGANAAAVAEQALALMLACAKSVVTLDQRTRTGHWDKSTHQSLELQGRTLGLVGLGAIGRRFARMASAMDMKVIGYDPYATDLPASIEPASLDAIWQDSDVISFHCPLTAENRGLLDAEALAQCKDGVIVVNTARGGLIDEDALLAAVESGKVAAAGLDSLQQEPPPADHPFFRNSKFVISPHIGGVTSDAFVNMGVAAAKNVLAELAKLR
ncbi:hydroxyacid dehydrogenase [Cupriavidus plantarum]|uniref:hydroxyacid dehydrogenase n=1 Tax=Cupriavidus plantarum TaxID=942865 RepID=UPI001B148328|nr:hydroxyacid dehydrogenase [Cupriavidus plantarum]CAG2134780.1 Hydroxypyruvate reductase [Cupriavidus plantarum]SMR84466.1 D-3-phosphoglycerate dehydrogenase [Cupriavidus plantarum]